MEKIEIYKSKDGKIFETKALCKKYELFLDTIKKYGWQLNTINNEHQYFTLINPHQELFSQIEVDLKNNILTLTSEYQVKYLFSNENINKYKEKGLEFYITDICMESVTKKSFNIFMSLLKNLADFRLLTKPFY